MLLNDIEAWKVVALFVQCVGFCGDLHEAKLIEIKEELGDSDTSI